MKLFAENLLWLKFLRLLLIFKQHQLDIDVKEYDENWILINLTNDQNFWSHKKIL